MLKYLSLIILLAGPLAYSDECHFELDKNHSQVGFIAYKFTEKTGVPGKFTKYKQTGPTTAKSAREYVEATQFEVDPNSVDTANPGRDETIRRHFFKLLKVKKISGKVISLPKGDKGTMKLQLRLNGTEKPVDLSYTLSGEKFSAKGDIDILEFDMLGPFEGIHKACKDLHKGKDGVSKTWSTVTLTVDAKLKKVCKK